MADNEHRIPDRHLDLVNWHRLERFIELNMPNQARRIIVHTEDPKIEVPAGSLNNDPHIVEFIRPAAEAAAEDVAEDSVEDTFPLEELTCVDAIATTLHNFDPRALANLLDFSKSKFEFAHLNTTGFEFYITRTENKVAVSFRE